MYLDLSVNDVPVPPGTDRPALLSVVINDSGESLLIGNAIGTVSSWDLSTGDLTHEAPNTEPMLVEDLQFIPNTGFAIASGEGLRLLDASSLSRGDYLLEDNFFTWQTKTTSDGKEILAIGSDGFGAWKLDAGTLSEITLDKSKHGFSLGLSPDGSLVILGLWDGTLEVRSRDRKTVVQTLKLTQEVRKILFDKAGKHLYVSAGGTVTTFDVTTSQQPIINPRDLRNGETVKSMALSDDDGLLGVGDDQGKISIYAAEHTAETASDARFRLIAILNCAAPGSCNQLIFTRQGKFLLGAGEDGAVHVWEMKKQTEVLQLFPGANRRWLALTPGGLFDGDADAFRDVAWRFDKMSSHVLPLEAARGHYYHPGLVAEIFAGEEPKADVSLADIDSRQPQVTMKSTISTLSATEHIVLSVQAAPPDDTHPENSGVRDLHVYRNGILAKLWRGNFPLDSGGRATLNLDVSVVNGSNRFSAHAFSSVGIQGPDSSVVVRRDDLPSLPRTVYVVAFGANNYLDKTLQLKYAVADATDFVSELSSDQSKLPDFAKVVSLDVPDPTKDKIVQTLKDLKTQPQDRIFLLFSGHGVSFARHFYYLLSSG
jgi:WD40 repeat protein